MEYHSKYTGAEVDALLDKIAEDNVGDIDSALSTTSENPVMNKVVTAELNKKATKDEVTTLEAGVNANKDLLETQGEKIQFLDQSKPNTTGYYPSLHVGTADDLAGRGESVPAEFGFRASGGKSIKDGRAYIKAIKGNSVVWNQLWDINGDNRTDNAAIKAINESEIVLTLQDSGANSRIRTAYTIGVVGHKYYVTYQAKYNSKSDDSSLIAFVGMSTSYGNQLPLTNSYQTYSGIWVGDYAGAMNVGVIGTRNDGDIVSFKDIKVIDLTQMFQAGNEPTTIEEFNARVATLGVDMNAYNEGQVIHCNTESIKSVGDNAWDEEWRNGYYVGGGIFVSADTQICNTNPIKVLPNEQYYLNFTQSFVYFYDANMTFISTKYIGATQVFTTPSNAQYINFGLEPVYGSTYNNDIMLTLVHSGWKQDTDAGYQEYWQDTLPLPIIRNYFPDGMKKAGSAHDEIRYNKASGKWEAVQRIGSVDMGDMAWVYNETFGGFVSKPQAAKQNWKGVCSKYHYAGGYATVEDKEFGFIYLDQCFIKDSAYTDAATFKAAMAGVILYYELAEPIVTELDAEDQNFRDYYQVADFGTEMSQSAVPSAPFSADIIYQFNAVDMIREHELEITELQNIIATMQAQLASLTSNNE